MKQLGRYRLLAERLGRPIAATPCVDTAPILEREAARRGGVGFLAKNTMIIAGVKSLFNTDPPFSATYDTNTGAGSSWEPRIADPRGRSFTLKVDYNFY